MYKYRKYLPTESHTKSMMQPQIGERAPPASSTQAEEEVNVGIIAGKDALNQSTKKLQQACRKKVATTVAVASIVEREAAQWMAKVEVWIRREGRSIGARIFAQKDIQIREWFAEVKQAVEGVKNRAHPFAANLVSLTETNASEVENLTKQDLTKAIVGVKKIVAWIDMGE
jgi:hypothetical protein